MKINTTILCRLTVDKMLKKYIYIVQHMSSYKISRSSTVDVKSFSMKVLHDQRRLTVDTKSSFLLTISSEQLIVDIVNIFMQNIRKYGLLSFRILGRHNHRINMSNGISQLKRNAESRVDRVV